MKKSIMAAAAFTAGVLAASPAAAQSSAPTPPCRDPWVSQAVQEVQGRTALGNHEAGECNIQLYGARWGSYGELKGYVQQVFATLKKAGLEFDEANGRLIRDTFYYPGRYASATIYVGPRAGMPQPAKNWVIALPSGNVMAIERPCRPGYSSVPPGCVRDGKFDFRP